MSQIHCSYSQPAISPSSFFPPRHTPDRCLSVSLSLVLSLCILLLRVFMGGSPARHQLSHLQFSIKIASSPLPVSQKKKFMCIPGANSSPCSPDADSRRVDEASIPRLARTCESASLLNLSSARKSDLNTPRLGSHSLRSARSPPPVSYPVTLFSSAVGRMPFRRCCPIPGTGGCRRCLALPGPSAVAALLQAWEGATTAVLQAQEGTA